MPTDDTTLRSRLTAELPFLRRYARAITGSQTFGDAAVREVLEAIVADPAPLRDQDDACSTKVELYRLFHRIWQPQTLAAVDTEGDTILGELPVLAREALLLTTVECFSPQDAAAILELNPAEVEDIIASARALLTESLHGAVMIIEDESIIAIHLQQIVRSLGNTIAGVARTRREAVALAREARPDLILADISLADGSSGIDAVKDILRDHATPVIFITAFPERLLTGERPEPTYLITKPFEPETVAATIWQAMLVHREAPRGLQAA